MNFIGFSPYFPPNYTPFWVELRRKGATVLGLGDAPYDELRPELRGALNEYYRVGNAHHYDELVRALGYFTHRYGKIDRLESHNEYWLESDARLRTDFNIPGFHNEDMARIKRKSEMKKVFLAAGLHPARGVVAHNVAQAKAFADEVGYPLIAKPDIGVGAASTHKLQSRSELTDFFDQKPLEDYIFEEYIAGDIETFDGLTDQDAQIVFSSSMKYNTGVMETVNKNLEFWYCMRRVLPADLVNAGERIVNAYQLRERFFHFEFFRTPKGKLVPLEVNMRPPGGLTIEMFNYANDIDIYCEYANVVLHNRFEAKVKRPYFCAYVGRRSDFDYKLSVEEVLHAYPKQAVHHEQISGIFSAAIGDYGFILRSPDEEELFTILDAIVEKE